MGWGEDVEGNRIATQALIESIRNAHMQNIECKHELRDLKLARILAKFSGASFIGELQQTDTYFKLANGRLKKRECAGELTEWVHYDRTNLARARVSHFVIFSEDEAAERFGTQGLPQWVVVRKKRELYIYENVRIHLDQVESLGTFIEFEALVSPVYTIDKCHAIVSFLQERFGPSMGEAIAVSYCDMMAAAEEANQEARSNPA